MASWRDKSISADRSQVKIGKVQDNICTLTQGHCRSLEKGVPGVWKSRHAETLDARLLDICGISNDYPGVLLLTCLRTWNVLGTSYIVRKD